MSADETIVAAATPVGESALAVVRVSGPLSESLAEGALALPYPTPRRACLADYRDLRGEVVDQVVCVFYASGKSYTGEAMLEISSHGNPLLSKKIVEDLVARGCRLAEPGEFTRRAYLAGRMDLTQAESVATLIRARSDKALASAARQLRGALGARMKDLLSRLLDLRASLEAYVDFPEEDLPPENLEGPPAALAALLAEVSRLRSTAGYGRLLEAGARCLIVGPPNAGKSTLLNALSGEDRAIVSEEAGTTRDYLSIRVEVGDLEVELIDTAGLRQGGSEVERRGIEKTLELARETDCFLYVIDSSLPDQPGPEATLLSLLSSENALVLENKTDLPDSRTRPDFLPELAHLPLSLEAGEGLDECRAGLEKLLELPAAAGSEDGVVVNARHAERLGVSEAALTEARRLLLDEGAVELALSEIQLAQDALGDVVGRVDNEDVLDRLFRSFCIGK